MGSARMFPMAATHPTIPRVIKALQESEDDPASAIKGIEVEAEKHEAEAKALRQAVVAIQLLTGQMRLGPSSPSDETPSGMEAIRRVMREGGVWTARMMFEELKKRGWEPKKAKHPQATVEAAMDRLYRVKKEIDRVGRGEYTMKGFPASPSLETLGDFAS
jgi:hypothetical protein